MHNQEVAPTSQLHHGREAGLHLDTGQPASSCMHTEKERERERRGTQKRDLPSVFDSSSPPSRSCSPPRKAGAAKSSQDVDGRYTGTCPSRHGFGWEGEGGRGVARGCSPQSHRSPETDLGWWVGFRGGLGWPAPIPHHHPQRLAVN